MNPRRLIVLLYVVILAGLGIGAGGLFFEARAEYVQLAKTQTEMNRRLAEAKKRLAQQERILERLKTDPSYVEKIMRKRNYARPDDGIYLFETLDD
ncbi:MAG: septum formation initiator family protein [Opitutaceae bacterium]